MTNAILSDQRVEQLRVMPRKGADGVAFARALDASLTETGTSQQEMSRRLSLTPGMINHYLSMVRVLAPGLLRACEAGTLTFKEARALATLGDHARQLAMAAPFLDGRLSSCHVEAYVARAKGRPDLGAAQIADECRFGRRPEPEEKAEPEPVAVPPPPCDVDALEAAALKLAGEVAALRPAAVPGIARLRLGSCLRILDAKVRAALWQLEGHR